MDTFKVVVRLWSIHTLLFKDEEGSVPQVEQVLEQFQCPALNETIVPVAKLPHPFPLRVIRKPSPPLWIIPTPRPAFMDVTFEEHGFSKACPFCEHIECSLSEDGIEVVGEEDGALAVLISLVGCVILLQILYDALMKTIMFGRCVRSVVRWYFTFLDMAMEVRKILLLEVEVFTTICREFVVNARAPLALLRLFILHRPQHVDVVNSTIAPYAVVDTTAVLLLSFDSFMQRRCQVLDSPRSSVASEDDAEESRIERLRRRARRKFRKLQRRFEKEVIRPLRDLLDPGGFWFVFLWPILFGEPQVKSFTSMDVVFFLVYLYMIRQQRIRCPSSVGVRVLAAPPVILVYVGLMVSKFSVDVFNLMLCGGVVGISIWCAFHWWSSKRGVRCRMTVYDEVFRCTAEIQTDAAPTKAPDPTKSLSSSSTASSVSQPKGAKGKGKAIAPPPPVASKGAKPSKGGKGKGPAPPSKSKGKGKKGKPPITNEKWKTATPLGRRLHLAPADSPSAIALETSFVDSVASEEMRVAAANDFRRMFSVQASSSDKLDKGVDIFSMMKANAANSVKIFDEKEAQALEIIFRKCQLSGDKLSKSLLKLILPESVSVEVLERFMNTFQSVSSETIDKLREFAINNKDNLDAVSSLRWIEQQVIPLMFVPMLNDRMQIVLLRAKLEDGNKLSARSSRLSRVKDACRTISACAALREVLVVLGLAYAGATTVGIDQADSPPKSPIRNDDDIESSGSKGKSKGKGKGGKRSSSQPPPEKKADPVTTIPRMFNITAVDQFAMFKSSNPDAPKDFSVLHWAAQQLLSRNKHDIQSSLQDFAPSLRALLGEDKDNKSLFQETVLQYKQLQADGEFLREQAIRFNELLRPKPIPEKVEEEVVMENEPPPEEDESESETSSTETDEPQIEEIIPQQPSYLHYIRQALLHANYTLRATIGMFLPFIEDLLNHYYPLQPTPPTSTQTSTQTDFTEGPPTIIEEPAQKEEIINEPEAESEVIEELHIQTDDEVEDQYEELVVIQNLRRLCKGRRSTMENEVQVAVKAVRDLGENFFGLKMPAVREDEFLPSEQFGQVAHSMLLGVSRLQSGFNKAFTDIKMQEEARRRKLSTLQASPRQPNTARRSTPRSSPQPQPPRLSARATPRITPRFTPNRLNNNLPSGSPRVTPHAGRNVMSLIQNVEVKEEKKLSLRQLMQANEESQPRDNPVVLSKQFTVLRPTPPTPPRRSVSPKQEPASDRLSLSSSAASTPPPLPSHRTMEPDVDITPTGLTPTPKCIYQQAQLQIRRESKKSEARDSMVYSSDGSELENLSPFNCKNLAETQFKKEIVSRHQPSASSTEPIKLRANSIEELSIEVGNVDCVDSSGSSSSSGSLRLPPAKVKDLPTDSSCFDSPPSSSKRSSQAPSTPAFVPRLDFKSIQQVQSSWPMLPPAELPLVPASSQSVSSASTSQPFMRYDRGLRKLVPSHSSASYPGSAPRSSFSSTTFSELSDVTPSRRLARMLTPGVPPTPQAIDEAVQRGLSSRRQSECSEITSIAASVRDKIAAFNKIASAADDSPFHLPPSQVPLPHDSSFSTRRSRSSSPARGRILTRSQSNDEGIDNIDFFGTLFSDDSRAPTHRSVLTPSAESSQETPGKISNFSIEGEYEHTWRDLTPNKASKSIGKMTLPK